MNGLIQYLPLPPYLWPAKMFLTVYFIHALCYLVWHLHFFFILYFWYVYGCFNLDKLWVSSLKGLFYLSFSSNPQSGKNSGDA